MDLLDKLKVISDITEGKTLSTYRGNISLLDHNSWYTTIWRTASRENKNKTILCIKEIMDDGIVHLDEPEIRQYMYAAIEGMERLKKTYTDFIDIVIKLDSMIIYYKNVLESSMLGEVYNQNSIELSEEHVGEVDLSLKTNEYLYRNEAKCEVKNEVKNEIKNEIDEENEIVEKVSKKELGVDFLQNVTLGNYDMVETYLYSGNDANFTTYDGKNAIHLICDKKHFNLKMLKLLYAFHIDATAYDKYGYDPRYYAESTLCTEALLFLNQNLLKKKLATRA